MQRGALEPQATTTIVKQHDFPPEARELMASLLEEPLDSPAALRKQLADHVAEIKAAAQSNEFLDISLAMKLAEVSSALIDEGLERGDTRVQHLIQAAVRYFILDDDGEHDLESVCGLDDDAEVCNVVSRSLGRQDLLIDV